jgi:hypothetical protein
MPMKGMKAMRKRRILMAGVGGLLGLAALPALAQPKVLTPDLTQVASEKGWKLINRAVTTIEKDGKPGVRFEDTTGIGVAWLEGITFADGTIEVDVRGANLVQHSFVGVAFHGADSQTYDAVYFRPFNFKSEDAARRLRAVQYIAQPTLTWAKLRQEHPGEYEKPVVPAPDPDGWFHVRVVVAWPKVSVFVNDAKEACLTVDQLSDRKRGRIGLWVDTGGGEFANLKIR